MLKTRKPLADRIRAEIVRLNVTKYRVHKDTGLPETTVGRFMNGKDPTITTAEILLDYIGWTVGPAQPRRRTKR